MANGKELNEELHEVAKDPTVPMKIKVGLLSAQSAAQYDLLLRLNDKLDKIEGDYSSRLQGVETKAETNLNEINNLRNRSDKNDWISSILTAAAALFGIVVSKQ